MVALWVGSRSVTMGSPDASGVYMGIELLGTNRAPTWMTVMMMAEHDRAPRGSGRLNLRENQERDIQGRVAAQA